MRPYRVKRAVLSSNDVLRERLELFQYIWCLEHAFLRWLILVLLCLLLDYFYLLVDVVTKIKFWRQSFLLITARITVDL